MPALIASAHTGRQVMMMMKEKKEADQIIIKKKQKGEEMGVKAGLAASRRLPDI